MNSHECVERALLPIVRSGEYVEKGRFVRNLEKAQKFDPGEGAPPPHGYRIRAQKWDWVSDKAESLGPSVCQEGCLASLRCAILMNPDPDRYRHVIRMDLEALSRFTKQTIVAFYTPVDGPAKNPCHFELFPLECHPETLKFFFETLDAKLGLPIQDSPEIRKTREDYNGVFEFILDVHTPSTAVEASKPSDSREVRAD